jgi:hypothetical protein
MNPTTLDSPAIQAFDAAAAARRALELLDLVHLLAPERVLRSCMAGPRL